ncbi:MAG: fluoride efflux transporter CrcB [Actinomycetota bacterium]|nr:fluoride efflux transporter CrcB [Actinomycetota bacterium]
MTGAGLYLTVAAGGAVGAPARYLLDVAVAARSGGRRFPLGTFIVNVSGAFVLGLVVGAALHHGLSATARAGLGTGFCGAYTTFSAFSCETVRLLEDGSLGAAALYVTASVAVGLVAASIGLALALVV